MTYLQTDGTLDGIFCAIFFAFSYKISNAQAVYGAFQPSLTDSVVKISTDLAKAKRVQTAVARYGGSHTLYACQTAMRSGEEKKHAVVFNYLTVLLTERRDVKNMLSIPDVLAFENLLKRIWCEVHRFEGFIRFSQSNGGTYYAPYSPDHDITDLLLPHFIRRYGATSFAIHDTLRKKIGVWNGTESAVFDCPLFTDFFLAKDEQALQSLWKTYYKAITITQRPHEKQMLGYMPRRYWKYLTEKNQ